MMHKYIGARYVPRFMGTYDNTQQYENLDVVDNGLGTSYIAKKIVPPGTSLTDTNYWALYGASSGAIISLQDQINEINTLLGYAGYNDAYRNRRIVIVGDSYADTNPDDYAYIIQAAGIFKQVDVVAGGGWGFTGKDGAGSGTTGPTLEWLTHFTAYVNGLSDEDKEEISDVYIVGGFNDHYSTFNVILSHMADFFTYANAALPKAQFHVGLCAWAKDGTVVTPNETTTGATLRNTISSTVLPAYQRCVEYGAEYMGNFIWEIHDYINDFDATLYHPSAVSSAKIARALLSKMLGHKYEDDTTHAQNIKVSGTDTLIGAVRRNGNNIDFVTNYLNTMIFYADADVTAANPYVIPDWYPSETYNWIGARGGANNYGFRCMIRLSSPGEKFHPCDVSVDATTGKLKINSVPFNLTNGQPYRITFMNSSFSYLDC